MLVEELAEAKVGVADMVRLTDLHRGTVYRYLKPFRELSPEQREARWRTRQAYLGAAGRCRVLIKSDRLARERRRREEEASLEPGSPLAVEE